MQILEYLARIEGRLEALDTDGTGGITMMAMSPDGVLLIGLVLGLIVGLLVAVVFKKGSQ